MQAPRGTVELQCGHGATPIETAGCVGIVRGLPRGTLRDDGRGVLVRDHAAGRSLSGFPCSVCGNVDGDTRDRRC